MEPEPLFDAPQASELWLGASQVSELLLGMPHGSPPLLDPFSAAPLVVAAHESPPLLPLVPLDVEAQESPLLPPPAPAFAPGPPQLPLGSQGLLLPQVKGAPPPFIVTQGRGAWAFAGGHRQNLPLA
mmetsp:Transcript_52841/g.147138  ORF Transcript_52841/g.147138 Transcript_52841/m.147138 type:complete len:127 (-) Transcript_52841:12-392(-)